jgi:pyridine nucleotide-disulfide oxidoreductase
VVAGGGFSGAELAGGLNDFARGIIADYPNLSADDLRIILVHSRERILPELSESLANYAMQRMRERGVTFKLNTRRQTPDRPGEAKFSLSRAVVVGGLAGIVGGWAFGQWMAKVDHFPLIAGLIHLSSRNAGVALHFVFAFIIGASSGLLFQRDVRGYGSCLGWGLGYGIFWWFLGPMTIMPLWQGRSLDWSYYHGQELFGSLVGHVVYGLIVGVIYAAVDRLWIALFIERQPLTLFPCWLVILSMGRSRQLFSWRLACHLKKCRIL